MRQYYFLASALAPLEMGKPPEFSFASVMFACELNLSSEDWEQVSALRRYYDVENVRALLQGTELDSHAMMDRKELEEAMRVSEELPSYFRTFFQKYPSDRERLDHYGELVAAYFQQEGEKSEGFLHHYLALQRQARLFFTALRASRLGRDLSKELQWEDPNDEFVAQLLSRQELSRIEVPAGLEPLKRIWDEYEQRPLAFYLEVYRYTFEAVEKLLAVDLFSVERILGYIVQLIAVEKWLELDKQKGLRYIDQKMKMS